MPQEYYTRARVEEVLRKAFNIPNDARLAFNGGMVIVVPQLEGKTREPVGTNTDNTPATQYAASDSTPEV
jgi:hypothetical protein